jgi:hypothetical protein
MAIPVYLLEIHAAHACNLTCESCEHFSNNGHRGIVEPADAEAWMRSWQGRIVPGLFRIMGGEPTLNPHLSELIELAAQCWPSARIVLTTNGFFLHRHPDLPEVMSRHKVILDLTIHHHSEAYLAKVRDILGLIQEWQNRHPLDVVIEEAVERWTRRYRGFGTGVLPYEDAEPRKSWEVCPVKLSLQLFRGRLWKCPPITYLHLQKETYPAISSKWDDYLKYQGLGPECSDGELHAFLFREEEAVCGMCAVAPESFDKPSPLIPLGVLRKSAGEMDLAE